MSRIGASHDVTPLRFVASVEAGAPKIHKKLVLKAGHGDIVRTLVYSGRPMRVFRTPFVDEWYAPPLDHFTPFNLTYTLSSSP